ncbi:MAG: CDP-archaeol synthase, partial [Acidobacteriaceae bacterium]|nr:CDP-archaeol synthase [Acidobacteriaceae bacterium]
MSDGTASLNLQTIGELLILLAVANVTPILANNLLGSRWSYPVDGRLVLFDHQRLFGASKTFRGILASIVATSTVGLLFGMGWELGAALSVYSMGGDLFSSFWKRRLGLPAGSRASGLDQVPESLFPALGLRQIFALTPADIGVVVACFFVGEIVLSRVFFK